MVNLEWYRSFVAIYRIGTVSGAAQVLHLTQPAVSQHLAALETALGQQLFQRLPRKMLPTVEGQSLYTQVIAAIEQLESIADRSLPGNTPQILRLGTPPEFFADRLLPRLSQDSQYRVTFGLAPDLIEQLLAGKLDAVIATQKIAKSELEYQLVAEENFWLVAPPNDLMPIDPKIAAGDLATLEQWLRTQPLIAYSEELPIIRRFWRLVFGRRLDIVPALVLPDLRMIRESIAAGLGFSVLPDYLCTEMVTTKTLALLLKPTTAITNQIWLAYRKSERQSQQTLLLLELLGITHNNRLISKLLV
jgi:DNA-binding transcriptional LysR family regulator